MHLCDTAAFIDGGQGLLPLGDLTNHDGVVVTDGLAVAPPFSRGHTLVDKQGITVIHKQLVVRHHLGLLPHPWGTFYASATELFMALGPLSTHAEQHIFQKFANAMQLVVFDEIQRMSPCLRGSNTWNPRRRLTYKPPGPLLPLFLPPTVQILGCCTIMVLQRDPTCVKNIRGPIEVEVPAVYMHLRPQLWDCHIVFLCKCKWC